MPVSDASVSALKNIFRSLVMAIAWRLRNRNWRTAKTAGRSCFPRSCARFSGVDSGMAGKAIPELQQAVRATRKTVRLWGRWARHIHRKAIRQCSGESGKSPRTGPAQQQHDKWNSLLKVNRYWLAIQQGVLR